MTRIGVVHQRLLLVTLQVKAAAIEGARTPIVAASTVSRRFRRVTSIHNACAANRRDIAVEFVCLAAEDESVGLLVERESELLRQKQVIR